MLVCASGIELIGYIISGANINKSFSVVLIYNWNVKKLEQADHEHE